MRKRLFCLLLTVMLTVLSLPVLAETGDWVAASDDESLEVRFVSWEESDTYPTYKLKLQFRLDRQQESKECTWAHDLSDLVDEYITENPSQKNRKKKATCSGEIIEFVPRGGTIYSVRISCKIGDKEKILYSGVDLASEFPDDFINYDAYNAAAFLKAFVKEEGITLYEFSDFGMGQSSKNKDIVLYTFSFVAANKGGSKSSVGAVASYNIDDGSVYVFYYNTAITGTCIIGKNYETIVDYPKCDTTIWASSIKLYY